MKITFIGHGYVGLVTAAVLADFGNEVVVIGHTRKKIDDLKRGIIPFYEPGLSELVKKNIEAKRLTFTLDYTPAIPESDAVFIAVGTPPTKTGDADLSAVLSVAEQIGKNLEGYTVVATKSTVPTGTNKKIQRILEETKRSGAEVDYASVPEFLREGTAIADTTNPDRVVIGTESPRAQKLLVKIHEPIGAPILLVNFETAELIKYASNSFLAYSKTIRTCRR
jgi:UDPglucose 6-dehydrogenase